jgi:hypothetical protein
MGDKDKIVDDGEASKTKRLLSLLNVARSKLEENQITLAGKDQQISNLLKTIEEERNQHRISRQKGGKDEEHIVPRNILRRVDVDDIIWILIEYEGVMEDAWKFFYNEDDLSDFIQNIPGAPVSIPERCLTNQESSTIELESKKKVDRLVEEFRRFKVQTEIARKQKDAEMRNQSNLRGNTNTLPISSLTLSLDKPNNNGSSGLLDELNRMKLQLKEQEIKWRNAYEKVVKDNELIISRGSDAILATQWRERYENCMRDKNQLVEKLNVYNSVQFNQSGGNDDLSYDSARITLEQAYIDLRDEYQQFRHRIKLMEHQRMNEFAPSGSPVSSNSCNSKDNDRNGSIFKYIPADGNNHKNNFIQNLTKLNSLSSSPPPLCNLNGYNSDKSSLKASGESRNVGIHESKMQYIKQMVYQYLSCRDTVVKTHIETALITLLRYSDEEKAAIELRSKNDSIDTVSSISSLLGISL